jgi:DNA-binding NarL/FixJ family response regulator
MFIDGVKALLRKEKDFQFVGEVNDGDEALSFLETTKVDLLITDISMPKLSGVNLVKAVKQKWPELKILVISMHSEKEIIAEIMLAEAEGYILKNAPKVELIDAINEISSGGVHYANEVMKIMLQRIKKTTVQERAIQQLTPRELEIVKLIVQEYSTLQIAEMLFISPRTVDTHRKNIMFKTESKTIIGLMKFVFQNDLMS